MKRACRRAFIALLLLPSLVTAQEFPAKPIQLQ